MAKAKKKTARKVSKKKPRAAEDYAALTTTEAKEAAIVSAGSVKELRAMWTIWEKHGLSRDGMLHASLLKQKEALGSKLTKEEKQLIQAADSARAIGEGLPPISGKLNY